MRHIAQSLSAGRCNRIAKPEHAAKVTELQAKQTRVMAEVGLTDDKTPLDEGIKQPLPDQKIR